MGKLLNDFKQFAMRGNVLDMAVGVIIGGAFGKLPLIMVTSSKPPSTSSSWHSAFSCWLKWWTNLPQRRRQRRPSLPRRQRLRNQATRRNYWWKFATCWRKSKHKTRKGRNKKRKQVAQKRQKHLVHDAFAHFGLLLYIHWALRIICLTVLPFHFFSDASAWQNAAYPDVPGHILAESALAWGTWNKRHNTFLEYRASFCHVWNLPW